jgi:hypothetical protein
MVEVSVRSGLPGPDLAGFVVTRLARRVGQPVLFSSGGPRERASGADVEGTSNQPEPPARDPPGEAASPKDTESQTASPKLCGFVSSCESSNPVCGDFSLALRAGLRGRWNGLRNRNPHRPGMTCLREQPRPSVSVALSRGGTNASQQTCVRHSRRWLKNPSERFREFRLDLRQPACRVEH